MARTFFDLVFPRGRSVTRDVGSSSYNVEGILISRALPLELSEREYLQILCGGDRRRVDFPDWYSSDGVPHWTLPETMARQAQLDLDQICLDRIEVHNVACNAGRTVMLNFIANAGGLTGVQYFAVGTGSGTPTSGDTQLNTEYFRKVPTATTTSGNQEIITTTFLAGEGNTTYTEAGLFGDGATGSANSGQLFSHVTYVYTKTASIQLNNQYTMYLT